MSLHNQIMNLPTMDKAGAYAIPANRRECYALGHRDARHQAAELALKADSTIADLLAALKWYVEHDTTGDSEYYEAGRQRAIAVISKAEEQA